MSTVEKEAYKPPSENYDSLARSRHLRDDITEPGNFDDLPQIAEELGFQRVTPSLLTRKPRHWQVWVRPNHDVPNFPDGATRVSSTLAIYDNTRMAIINRIPVISDKPVELRFTHAILRTSREPYSPDECARDLDAFTRHYIKRPRILGFPSQELTKLRYAFVALGAGMVLGVVADYHTVQSVPPGSANNFGAPIGGMAGLALYVAAAALGERHASRQISDLKQYIAGDGAREVLLGERHHVVRVAIQRELYQVLQQEGVNLTPDQFLHKIYEQIPPALVNKRHAEVEQAKYPKLDSPRKIGNSLPQLIEVSHVL